MSFYARFSRLLFLIVMIAGPSPVYSMELQSDNWNLNLFGYVTGRIPFSEEAGGKDIELGETSVFVFGRLSSRLSVLTEFTVLPKKYREDTVKVERLRLRFDWSEKHWLSLGKMHTPVNYWNDSFHHGRYFFPTIDRPSSFKHFVPIHDIGLRFSGNRLGKYGFFYDVVLGSRYIGGQISPGLEMRFFALNHYTGNLPKINFKSIENFIGKTTESSILIGVYDGLLYEINGILEKYKLRYPGIDVILTGGHVKIFKKKLRNINFINPYLLIHGLNYIIASND